VNVGHGEGKTVWVSGTHQAESPWFRSPRLTTSPVDGSDPSRF